MTDGNGLVNYNLFIDDYDRIEKKGLGAGFDQLDRDKIITAARDTSLKRKAGQAGSWRLKTISELSPPESKQLYERMSGYLLRKNLIDTLCLSLVNAD